MCLPRRVWWVGLWAALFLVAGALSSSMRLSSAPRTSGDNPVVVENQQPGSDQWRLRRPGFRVSDDATGQIKGYASATSVNRGQPITFYVSVNPAQTFTIDLYRVGWYGGLGARLLQHIGPL